MLDAETQKIILAILDRGNHAEIRRNKEGIVIYEVRKQIKQKIPDASGRQEEPKGAANDR